MNTNKLLKLDIHNIFDLQDASRFILPLPLKRDLYAVDRVNLYRLIDKGLPLPQIYVHQTRNPGMWDLPLEDTGRVYSVVVKGAAHALVLREAFTDSSIYYDLNKQDFVAPTDDEDCVSVKDLLDVDVCFAYQSRFSSPDKQMLKNRLSWAASRWRNARLVVASFATDNEMDARNWVDLLAFVAS